MLRGITVRTSWHTYFLDIALRCAKQGTCRRRNRGAIIVNAERRIIATGYSGTPSGCPHCTELNSCLREQYNVPSGQRYEFCRSIHAEMNALLQAGQSARGCDLYLAGVNVNDGSIIDRDSPCLLCAKLIVQAGIKRVIILQADRTYNVLHPNAILLFRSEEAVSSMISQNAVENKITEV